jgi:phage protein D
MEGTKLKKRKVTAKFKVELVELALRKLHKQLESEGELKATLGDIIRLVEAHNSMEQETSPKQVLIRWIDQPSDNQDSEA